MLLHHPCSPGGGRLYLHCCSTVALHIVVVHRVCVQRAGGGASDSPPFFGWFPSSRADAVVGVICHGGGALGGESLRRRRRVNVRGGGGKGLVAAAKGEEGSLSPFSPFPGMIGIHTPPGKRGRKCRAAGERLVVATRYHRTVSNKRGGGVFHRLFDGI